MELKQIITATVAVILICLVAVPIINDGSESITTDANNTSYRYMSVSSESLSSDVTIEVRSDGKIYNNGVEIAASNTNNSVMCTDTAMWILSSTMYNYYDSTRTIKNLGLGGSTTFKTDGTYTCTNSTGTEYTGSYTKVIFPSNDGDMGYFYGSPTYIDKSSKAYFVSMLGTGLGALFVMEINPNGTGMNYWIEPFNATTGESLIMTDVSIHQATGDPEIVADYCIDGINYKIGDNNYNDQWFFAPIKYKTVSEMDGAIRSILDIIPVILVAAVILGIGYSIMRRE